MGARNQQEKWPKECAEPEKAFSPEKQRPEAYNLSPSAQGASDEEDQQDSPKSVLHNISFVVRKVGMCSKVRPEYDSV